MVAREAQSADVPERAVLEAMANGLRDAGLPLAVSGTARPRPRIAFAAPLPRGAEAPAEPVEVYLSERLTAVEMRRVVAAGLPPGFRLVDLEDEWVGAPSLASRVTAVEYRAEVVGPEVDDARPDSEASTLDGARVAAAADGQSAHGREGGQRIAVAAWDDEARAGVLVIRFTRDRAGRLGRPAEEIDGLGLGLRLARLVRTAVDVG